MSGSGDSGERADIAGPSGGPLQRLRSLTGTGTGSLMFNAGSLFGGTLLTAGLGAVYWALAARFLSPAAVGVGAAAISAMVLAGQVSTVGLGTVLMGELSHHRGSERSLIYSGVWISALVGLGLGIAAVVIAGAFIPELGEMRDLAGVMLFGIGAAVTAAGLVLDQAFLGLLKGSLQLVRNTVASLAKLGVLAAVGIGIAGSLEGETLLLTWVVGGIVSMSLLYAVLRVTRPGPRRTVWRAPGGLPVLAARHHVLNLSILAPGLLLPLVITAVLSAEANAYFYIAYLVASFAFAGPSALTTALYAAGSRDVKALASRVRLVFWISTVAGIALNLVMLVAAAPLLSVFGSSYADNAVPLLRLFSLGIFAVTINSLFVPIARIERRFLEGALLMVASMAIELVFVVAGAMLGGLEGAGVGWLVGYTLGILPLLPTVFRVGVQGVVRRIDADLLGTLPPPVVPPREPDEPTARDTGDRSASRLPERRTFAIATDGPVLERWQLACVQELLEVGAPIVLWLVRTRERHAPSPRAAALAATGSQDLPPELPPPTNVVSAGPSPYTVDVLLDLTRDGREHGRDQWPAGTPETWAFVFGREETTEPIRVALRSMVRGSDPIPVALKAWPAGRTLRAGAVRSTPGSLGLQLDRMLLGPAAWPAQAAIEPGTAEPPSPATGDAADRPAKPPPAAIPMPLLLVGATARSLLASTETLLRHPEWTIGIVRRPIAGWLGANATPAVSWLPRRPGRFAADPFGLERDGRIHVIFEDFDQGLGRGVISATSVAPSGAWEEPRVVLDTGSHASYPYLFEADGSTWMIPETSDLAEVRLYRATDFPHAWTLEARLLENTHVSDATVIRRGDGWWMFGTSRGRGVDEALRIWHAGELTGPWQPHGLDPVKIDVRSARPGGTPFVHDGFLYRPAQDCSGRYGGRLTINRVDLLDEHRFSEAPLQTIDPIPAFPDGLHTLSSAGSATLIDGNRLRFLPQVLRLQLAARFSGR